MKRVKLLPLLSVVGCLLFLLSACGRAPSGALRPNGQETEREPSGEIEQEAPEENGGNQMVDEIFLTVGNHKIAVRLEKNQAAEALAELLQEEDISYSASEYGGFEKVGALGHTLPRSDRQIKTEAGDVILYSGNQIVLFYGSNSWSYTRLGKMQGLSAGEIEEILTESDPLTVKLSLR